MVDALAPGGDEGRGELRYAPASCTRALEPAISEWGNPVAQQAIAETSANAEK